MEFLEKFTDKNYYEILFYYQVTVFQNRSSWKFCQIYKNVQANVNKYYALYRSGNKFCNTDDKFDIYAYLTVM